MVRTEEKETLPWSSLAKEMGVKHQCFVHLKETPYQLDVVLHTAHKADDSRCVTKRWRGCGEVYKWDWEKFEVYKWDSATDVPVSIIPQLVKV